MAYYFRIHKGTEVRDSRTGWEQTEVIKDNNTGIQSIDDTIDHIPASGKVGTSIPTPLARIYLFNTAFEALKDGGVKNETYEQLISDCLDLLQFLFEKGNDPDIKFYDIDIKAAMQKLRESRFEGDQVLADSLDIAVMDSDDFNGSFFIIEYKEIVIGGTSPFTMVYTSPNIRRDIRARDMSKDFMSNHKVELFGTEITHIEDRPKAFTDYLRQLYSHVTKNPGADKLPFFMYIVKKLGTLTVDKIYNDDEYKKKYPAIMFRTADDMLVSIGNRFVELSYDNTPFDASGSDFLMKPSLPCGRPPLVLPKSFGPSPSETWIYVDTPWNVNTRINDADCYDTPINDRKLPKNGCDTLHLSSIQYPWVSECDFFNENLIDLGYSINTDKFFYPACGEDITFLLPLKRSYFNYFTIEDLKKNLSVKNVSVSIEYGEDKKEIKSKELKSVTFSLTIPLKSSKPNIVLEKIYRVKTETNNDRKSVGGIITMDKPIGLGVFPFYKIINGADAVRRQDHDDNYYCNVKNEYAIYLFSGQKDKPLLEFYNCENSAKIIAIAAERTNSAIGKSTIYSIRPDDAREGTLGLTTFDFIEVSNLIKDSKDSAIIIPMLTEVESFSKKERAIFAVDFGTSNTHAAYWSYSSLCPQSLEIGKKEQQMVLLNKPKTEKNGIEQYRSEESFGDAAEMNDFLREFVPPIIGGDAKGMKKAVSYPIRTATLQGGRNLKSSNLFEGINIGYDIDNENVKLDAENFVYKTDLKWALQRDRTDVDAKNRVRVFFEETLWLLKNILVLQKMSNDGITLRYFFPESMIKDDVNLFRDEWKRCCEKVFTNCGFVCDDIKDISESVAPYYSLLRQNGDLLQQNSVNIDIGGGTTDIFIFDQGQDDGMEFKGFDSSIQFAADNIWGNVYSCDNKEEAKQENKNGFVKYYIEKYLEKNTYVDTNLKNLYENFSKKDDPESLTSLFFKYEDFEFGNLISSVPEFRFLLLLHYASIIYYVTDMIKCVRDEKFSALKFPKILTFTGKGSEYIKLITPRIDDISTLTKALFNAFGIPVDDLKGFEVQYPDNPKTLTADGGVYSCKDTEIKVDFVLKDDSNVFDESDTENKCVYRQIGGYLLGYDASDEDVPRIEDLKKNTAYYTDLIFKKFETFVNSIFDNERLYNIAYKMGVEIAPSYKQAVIERSRQSLDKYIFIYCKERSVNETKKIDGTLFFLALKESIINMSYDVYKNNHKNK